MCLTVTISLEVVSYYLFIPFKSIQGSTSIELLERNELHF